LIIEPSSKTKHQTKSMISFVVFVRTKNTQKSFVLIVSWISQKYLKNEENAKKEKSFVEEREIIK
jgi:hypothetical protein